MLRAQSGPVHSMVPFQGLALNHGVEGFVWPSGGHSIESCGPQYFEGGTPESEV